MVVQVNALKAKGIYESTALILCSKHGNSPINHTTLVRVPPAGLIAAINTVTPVASSNADTGAYIWLKNNTAANIQARALLTPPLFPGCVVWLVLQARSFCGSSARLTNTVANLLCRLVFTAEAQE